MAAALERMSQLEESERGMLGCAELCCRGSWWFMDQAMAATEVMFRKERHYQASIAGIRGRDRAEKDSGNNPKMGRIWEAFPQLQSEVS